MRKTNTFWNWFQDNNKTIQNIANETPKNQKRALVAALIIAWSMGTYKMLLGDHFFSHTLVSMSLAWGICAAVAWAWCRFYAKGVSAKNS